MPVLRLRRPATVLSLTAALLLVAAPAFADPAKPSNYRSTVLDVPDDRIAMQVEGGDSYLVMEVDPGVEVVVPGYDSDTDYTDIAELEVYLRVLADGTVQLNRNSVAYYQNGTRFGGDVPSGVGPDVAPDWETVATDGRVAWHDHRIHWMSPRVPDQVDTEAAEPQLVAPFEVPVLVDGDLVVATGELDYVRDGSPLPVLLVALLGLVAGGLLSRRDLRLGAVLNLLAGGVVVGLLLAAGQGRAAGFSLASPPVVLAAVGALAPLLGVVVGSLNAGQRKALVVLGGAGLALFGLLSTGALDAVIGGADGGFGNWWFRPTLPADVMPGLLRLAIGAGTGAGIGLLAAALTTPAEAPAAAAGADPRTVTSAETDDEADPGSSAG